MHPDATLPLWQRFLIAVSEFELMLYGVALAFWLLSFGFQDFVKVINTRPFFVNDATLWYEYSEDPMVSAKALLVLELVQLFLLGLLDMLLSLYLLHAVYKKWTTVIWVSLCSGARVGLGGLAATGISAAMVGLVKLFVGRLRPDYGHRCLGPNANFPRLLYDNAVLWGTEECVTDLDINPLASTLDFDARVSFISGHSAGAFCVGIFVLLVCLYRAWCILYWKAFDHDHHRQAAGKPPVDFALQVVRNHMHRYVAQALIFISLPSILLAAWVASTRIVDNRHHPADVVGGAAFGSLVSVAIFLVVLPAVHRDYFSRFVCAKGPMRAELHQDSEVEIEPYESM